MMREVSEEVTCDLWPRLTGSWDPGRASCCSPSRPAVWRSTWAGSAAWAGPGCSPTRSGCRWRPPVVDRGTVDYYPQDPGSCFTQKRPGPLILWKETSCLKCFDELIIFNISQSDASSFWWFHSGVGSAEVAAAPPPRFSYFFSFKFRID